MSSTRPSSLTACSARPARAALLLGLLCTISTHAAALSYADVGSGPFGSMSWVSRDYYFTSVSHYDGGPLQFLSSQADAWTLSYADAAMSGQSASSLIDGTLHVSAAAAAWGPKATGYTSAYLAGAGTAIWDRITLDADEGTHLIPLRMHVDGSIQGVASVQMRYYVGPNDPFNYFATAPSQGWHYLNGNPGGIGTHWWDTSFDLGSIRVDSVYEPWPMNVYFEMSVTAYSTRSNGGIGDFSHTATFNWDLPEGVTVQSASGQFMTAAPLPVPEPPSAVLALLGLTVLPALRRRRQRLAHRAGQQPS